jgi:hypothetical protein
VKAISSLGVRSPWTKVNPQFLNENKKEVTLFFSSAFSLIIWAMTATKSFEKIPILKT